MTRFVVVATLRRGALAQPEALDAENEAKALSRLRMEGNDVHVHWSRAFVPKMSGAPRGDVPKVLPSSGEAPGRVRRLMKLAGAS